MRAAIPLLSALLALSPAGADEPIESTLEEQVDVRLVILDVVVLDTDGRTVGDLPAEAFSVTVAGREARIDAVEGRCERGGADDPRSDERPVADDPQPEGRKVAVAFDYRHILDVSRAHDAARDFVEQAAPGTEWMVVNIGQGLHFETAFTDDREEVFDAVRRLESDPQNWAGPFGNLTEHRFFDHLQTLVHLLELEPGRKALVLFSGPLGNGFFYDPQYRDLAAAATAARVALYPVDSRGLPSATGFTPGDLGGPPKMIRMATATGGRATYNTNDLGLGLARAQRDLDCRYEIAFYDETLGLDRARSVRVWIDRPGLRVIHPEKLVHRSRVEKRRERARAATTAPEFFEAAGLQATLQTVRPDSSRKWQVSLALELPVEERPAALGPVRYDVVGELRLLSGAPVKKFRRNVTAADVADGMLETFRLRPGSYTLALAVQAEDELDPRAVRLRTELAPIPEDRPLVFGPVLGRPRRGEKDVDDGDAPFEPLIAGRAPADRRLAALTEVCWFGPRDEAPELTVERRLVDERGSPLGGLDEVRVSWTEGRRRCQALVDWLPVDALEGGRYRFEVLPRSPRGPGELAGSSFEVISR